MTEVLFIGDLHLEKLSHFKWSYEQGLIYQFQALDRAYRYALNSGIEHIIVLGDIFETANPKQSTIHKLAKFLAGCNKLPWHLIRGNHDYHDAHNNSLEVMYGFSELGALPHVRYYLSPEMVDLGGTPFLFLSYPYHNIKKWLSPKDFAVVVPHLEFTGAHRDNGSLSEHGLKLPKGVQQWVSGHLHTKQTIGKRLVYPGTMIQLNVVEGPKKFMLHTTIENETVQHQFIPYSPPCRLFNMVISSEADFERVELNNPNHRYRLVTKHNVKVPSKVMSSENIYDLILYRNKLQRDNAKQGFLAIAQQDSEIDSPLVGLKPYLEDKGLKPKLVKSAVKKANQIAKSLGIHGH